MKGLCDEISIICKALKFVNTITKHYISVMVTHAFFTALSPFIMLYFSALVVNSIVSGKPIKELITYVLVAVSLSLFCKLLNRCLGKVANTKAMDFEETYEWTLNRNVLEMDYIDVESYKTRELKESIKQLKNVNGMGMNNLIYPFKNIVENIFTIIFSTSIILPMFFYSSFADINNVFVKFLCSSWASILLVCFIIVNTFVNMIMVSKSTKKVYDTYASLVPANIIYSYYLENYIDSYHSGKDIRLYNQSSLISSEMSDLVSSFYPTFKTLRNIDMKYSSVGVISTTVINFLTYLFVGLRALYGLVAIGDVVKYIGGINQFITGFASLITQFTILKENTNALKLILEFICKESSLYKAHKQIDSKDFNIEFKNVSFKYPETENYVLKNLSIKINQGDRIAIVGMNGSGKTTMVKLLCRLYDPSTGEVTLNNINIKEYEYDDYKKLFSVVFQDFQLFSFSLGLNVATSVEMDKGKVISCLTKAGFANRLSLSGLNLETLLYNDFDNGGVEISGGEAQKIAVARALYKDAPCIVFDEPTAALDPIAEFELYENLNVILENKTGIFISHRMSSCKFCNKIAVFDQGELVQFDNHENLLSDSKGKYYELWTAQEQYYK